MSVELEEMGFHTQPAEKQEFCELHGEFTSKNYFKTRWSACPGCAADADVKRAEEQAEKDRLNIIARWESRIGKAGIPDRFQNRTLKSFVAIDSAQRAALEFSTTYAADFDYARTAGKSAVFVGRPGTGKTHLAIGIGISIMGKGYSVLFTTVMRAIRRVKNTWDRNTEETETDAIAALTFPDLLILDEVGIQFGSETEKLIIFDILNERYEQRKPSILISNLSLDDVRAYMGERIFDRMKEDGGQVIAFDWESHRGSMPA